jgi:hypothetical protein
MLEEGSVYIFSAKYNKDNGSYYVGSAKSTRIPLDIGSSVNAETARAVLEDQSDFMRMERAIEEQIPSRHNINN